MKYLHRNAYGYAILETILILSLVGIILTPMASFLMGNIAYYNRACDQIELQYQGQVAMNTITKEIIDAQAIARQPILGIYNEDGESHRIIKKISFKRSDASGRSKFIVYEHKMGEGNILKLFKTIGTSSNSPATTEFADYIEYLQIEPIDGDFMDCRGITIGIQLKKNHTTFTLTKALYFRNNP